MVAADVKLYFVYSRGQQSGPFSAATLEKMLNDGIFAWVLNALVASVRTGFLERLSTVRRRLKAENRPRSVQVCKLQALKIRALLYGAGSRIRTDDLLITNFYVSGH